MRIRSRKIIRSDDSRNRNSRKAVVEERSVVKVILEIVEVVGENVEEGIDLQFSVLVYLLEISEGSEVEIVKG